MRELRISRLLSVFLGLMVVLAGCSGGAGDEQAAGETSAETPAETSAETSDDELSPYPEPELVGKHIGLAVIVRGIALTEGWISTLERATDAYGMELSVRDANWDTEALVSSVEAFIDEGVDVLIVHNPDVSSTARLMEEAENQGIYVISVAQISNYRPTVHVGGEYQSIGASIGTDIVDACPSGKVALIPGDAAAGASTEQLAGATAVFEENPDLEVVSEQPGNWDPTEAHSITTTVLQQHPDLCAIYGFWDQMTVGAAQAVDEAGMKDQVKVYSLDSSQTACDAVRSGDFEATYSYGAHEQGIQLFTNAVALLRSEIEPGSEQIGVWGIMTRIDDSNVEDAEASGICY